MPQNEARAWWADAADVRESIERRRAGESDVDASPAVDELAHVRARRRRFEREQGAPAEASPRRTGRFDRSPAPTPAPTPPLAHARTERAEPLLAAVEPVSLPADAPHRALVTPVPRRTVQITGRPGQRSAPRLFEIDRGRRAGRPAAPRTGHRPDKLAMWAVMLGLFLILVAATSSHAAVLI